MRFSTSLLAVLSLVLATAGLPSQLGERAADAADPAWIQQVDSQHNAYRRQYGAPDLTWNDGLYTGTLQWATACNFAHRFAFIDYIWTSSNFRLFSGGAYGENLVSLVINFTTWRMLNVPYRLPERHPTTALPVGSPAG